MRASLLLLAVLGAVICAGAAAQESPHIEPLLPEIGSAKALAIRPNESEERHELLIADGDGRILFVASDAVDKPEVIVTGMKTAATAMCFVNGRTFIAATAEEPPQLRAYEIPDSGKPRAAEETKFEVRSATGVDGRTSAMTLGPNALYVVNVKNEIGSVLRSRVRSGVPSQIKPLANAGSRPTCVAISTRGWVVVGDAGMSDHTEDSRLMFLHPSDSTAEPALVIEPGLLDIAAIAYSPRERMYAIDTAESDPQRSGIYRIDMDFQDSRIGAKAVRVLSIEEPTAMTFAPDGTLYVIADDGKLFRVTGVE